MDSLAINRPEFVKLLGLYEELLALGFSKTELDSGDYRHDRVLNNLDEWQRLDPAIAKHRSAGKPSRLLQLISFVATKPEYIPPTKSEKVAESKPEPAAKTKNKAKADAQLSLF